MVDKNLFLYDLAIVAIMKNEGRYVKEWLDYHLAAGVNHFYIYDHESADNFKEVLQPYIDAGIVTYKLFSDARKQLEAYTEAFKAYRFFCRYLAFIDADEFIFPQSNRNIVEVIDEIMNDNPNIGGVEIQWMMYGTNFLETADYSKGVLERFTRRAAQVITTTKVVADPRKIHFIISPHYAYYFIGFQNFGYNSDEGSSIAEKILINHYCLKSREEFQTKKKNNKFGAAYRIKEHYNDDRFSHEKDNDIYDDSILKYRAARLQPGKDKVNPVDYEKIIAALIENLAPILTGQNTDSNFFEGKMETFLTCRALATYLKKNILDEERGKIIEEASLQAVYQTLFTKVTIADTELLLSELPKILPLNYPIVKNIFKACLEMLPQMKNTISSSIDNQTKMVYWRTFNEYDERLRLLQGFKVLLENLQK